MMIIKAEGKLEKESIAPKAVYLLKQLGEVIEEGNTELVSTIWNQLGTKIVDEAILNNIIQTVKYENPFALYHINNNEAHDVDVRRALVVSNKVKIILDNLAQAIIDLEITSEYDNLLPDAADAIKAYYDQKIGLSDTASREAMVGYFEGLLEPTFDAVDYTQMRQDFYEHL